MSIRWIEERLETESKCDKCLVQNIIFKLHLDKGDKNIEWLDKGSARCT